MIMIKVSQCFRLYIHLIPKDMHKCQKNVLCPEPIINHAKEVQQPTAGYTAWFYNLHLSLVLETIGQFPEFVDPLGCKKPRQLEKVMPRDIR